MEVGKYTYGTQHIRKMWDKCGKHSTEWITTFPFGTINKDIFNKKLSQGDRKNFKRSL